MHRLAHIIREKGGDFLKNVTTVVMDHFDIIRRDWQRDRDFKQWITQILDAMPDAVCYHAICCTTTDKYSKSLNPSDRNYDFSRKNHQREIDINGNHGFGAEYVMANPAMLFADYIDQCKITVRVPVEKFGKLGGLLLTLADSKTLIFVNNNEMVDELVQRLNDRRNALNLEFPPLRKYGAKVLSQRHRESVRKWMRNDEKCIVVATDLATRADYGFQNVIQYDLNHKSSDPRLNQRQFLRRMGRLMRAPNDHSNERKKHYCFIEKRSEDVDLLTEIETEYKVVFEEKKPRELPR